MHLKITIGISETFKRISRKLMLDATRGIEMKLLKLYRVLLIHFSYLITLNLFHESKLCLQEFSVTQFFSMIFDSLIYLWTFADAIEEINLRNLFGENKRFLRFFARFFKSNV